MRTRSIIPRNKKFFHTLKKFDKRDSASLKRKIHATHQHKVEKIGVQIRLCKYQRIKK